MLAKFEIYTGIDTAKSLIHRRILGLTLLSLSPIIVEKTGCVRAARRFSIPKGGRGDETGSHSYRGKN